MEELLQLLRGEDARRYRRAFSRVGWAMAALLLLPLGVQSLLQIAALFLAPALLEQPLFLYGASALASYGVGFPAALLILRSLPAQPVEGGRPLSPLRAAGVWALALGWCYLANLATLALMDALSSSRGAPISNPVADTLESQPMLFNLLLVCVLAPLAEELCFRRAVINRLRPWGTGFALSASSLLFALAHGNLYQFFYAFVVGFILGGLYLYTGRAAWTVLLHAGINFTSAGLLPLSERFGEGGALALSLLVLLAMAWAVGWTAAYGLRLLRQAGTMGWGSGEVWGHFFVNPGMTAFVLSVAGVVWLWLLV